MSQEMIVIEISPQGETKIEVKGCAGPSCSSLTAAIEKAVGRTVTDLKKPEFHQQSTQARKQGA
jgi:hypothetical protein